MGLFRKKEISWQFSKRSGMFAKGLERFRAARDLKRVVSGLRGSADTYGWWNSQVLACFGFAFEKSTKTKTPINDALNTNRQSNQSRLRARERQVLTTWVKPIFVSTNFEKPIDSRSGQKRLDRLVTNAMKKGSSLFPGEIARVGHVEIEKIRAAKRINGIMHVEIPIGSTNFFEFLQYHKSNEARRELRKGIRSREVLARMPERFPFDFGIDSILEVGNDGKGNQTHILMLRRSKRVPVAPSVWDFPAGIYKKGAEPFHFLKKRISAELGVEPKALKTIGPGMQPTNEEIFFALHKLTAFQCYNLIAVQRLNMTAEEVEKQISRKIQEGRDKRDPFTPSGFELIPRTPEAINKFRRTHPVFMNEVLGRYAVELKRARLKG